MASMGSVVVAEEVADGVLWEGEISLVSCYLYAQHCPWWGLSVTQTNKLLPHTQGRSTKLWTLYIDRLKSTAIHSHFFVDPPHMRALYIQAPFPPQSDASNHTSAYWT